MATKKSSATLALFLALNLVLCNVGLSSYVYQPRPLSQCPTDALKLNICADVLNGLVHAQIGGVQKRKCCSLIGNLVSLDAAACLCTAVHVNLLGIKLDLPIDLTLLVNEKCGAVLPSDYQCPPRLA